MSLFPSTLSSSLKRSLGPESLYDGPCSLVDKLEENPRNLLLFFQQACLNRIYVNKRSGLITLVLVRMTEYALTKVLNIDEVIKAYSMYLKFGTGNAFVIPTDIEVVDGAKKHKYSRIVMMRSCPLLKEEWLSQPENNSYNLRDFSPSLSTLDELDALYKTFLNDDFAAFEKEGDMCLQRALSQSMLWGYQEGSKTLQILFCKRISCINLALAELAIGLYNKHAILYHYCQSFIDFFRFYKLHADGVDSYSAFNVIVLDKKIVSQYLPADLIVFGDSFFNCCLSSTSIVNNIVLERLDICFVSPSSVVVCERMIGGVDVIRKVRTTIDKLERSKIDPVQVKKIVSDGNYPLKEVSLLGLIAYFTQVDEIDFVHYKSLSQAFITKLGEVRPSLKSITLEMSELDDSLIVLISIYLRQLVTINLKGLKLKDNTLAFLFTIETLKGILIANCQLLFIKPIGRLFYNVEHLALANMTNLSENLINEIFQSCENVKELTIVYVNNFKLGSYPYPNKLEVVMIDCDQLEKEIDKNTLLPSLKRLSNLNELKVFGVPSARLRTALIAYMTHKRKISFIQGIKF